MNKRNAIENIHLKLIDHFGPTENLSILDYGCGTGGLLKVLFHKQHHSSLVYAVDINPASIEKINNSYLSEIAEKKLITAVVQSPEQLKGNFFDGIFCHNVLELIENKEQFVYELYNLLNNNGIFILSHMDFDSIIYNSSFKELTRKLIHHFSDTKQNWMARSDGQIGRKIPGIINRLNLQKFSFETWRWAENSFTEHDYGYIMAQLLIKSASHCIDINYNDLIAWKKDLEQRAYAQDYFFAIDIDVAKIYK